MVKENSELKKLARSAKNRLKKGYWEGVQNADGYSVGSEGGIGYAAEEELYAKVRETLSSDECVMNPIGRLIDWARFEKMDQGERSAYVLELSKIYVRLKERYYREVNRKKTP